MRALAFIIFISFTLFSFSQDDASFQYKVINTSNGLNTNNVNDCITDSRGFLWIATDFGLTRFANQNSIHFVVDEATGKSFSNRTRLLIKDSILYVCGRPGFYKINIYDLKMSKIDIDFNYDDMVFYKNQIILSTREGFLLFFDTGSQHLKKINTGYGFLIDILVNGDDLFCLSLDKGCLYYDLKTNNLIKTIILHPFSFTDKMFFTSKKDVLLFNQNNIKRFDNVRKEFMIIPNSEKNITGYDEGPGHKTYFITNFSNLYFKDSNNLKKIIYPPVDKNTELKNIKVDPNGEVYVISNQGLIIFKRIIPFNILKTFNDNKSHVRRSIFEDTLRKRILFFSYDKLSIYNYLDQTYVNKEFLLYTHTAIQQNDGLILATEGSTINSLNLSDFSSKRLFIKEYRPLQFISFEKTIDGQYLLGTLDGLYTTNDFSNGIKKIALKIGSTDFSSMTIKAISVTKNNQIWIGGDQGIFVLNKNFKILKRYSTASIKDHKLPTNEVNCFYQSNDGIYAGLDGELVYIGFADAKATYLYSSVFGKSTNRIVSIAEDDRHDIWFSTYQGVFRFNKETGTFHSFHAPLYFTNDEFNRSSALKASNGKLYFGNIAEYIEINPDNYREKITASSLEFNSLKIFGESTLQQYYNIKNGDIIALPVEGSSVDLTFSLNDPINVDRFNYQYRLLNLDQEWLNLGKRSSVQLFSVPAGEHDLQIRAIGEDGYTSNILKMKLHVPVVFYKTTWFIVSLILGIGIIVFFIYWNRVKGLKKMLQLRKDIAYDLHDSVGTVLTKSIYSVQSILDESPIKDKRLQKVIDYNRQIHLNFRDVLWSMDASTDQILNLFDRIYEIGNTAVENTPFIFKLKKEKIRIDFSVSKRKKREILLITREAINNILKHSTGDIILFEFAELGNKIKLTISDNGQNNDDKIEYEGGMGLKSIQMRVKKFGGTISIEKRSDGFAIDIIL
jgi:hypothetical protein